MVISLGPGGFQLIVCLYLELFVFWMLTMTCQSSPLIRVLKELCLPRCTLKSDFQLPRQLQLIWLHARETALPYFSASSVWRHIFALKESILFLCMPFYTILSRSLVMLSMLNQSPWKNDFFSKRSLSSRKETLKISAFVSVQSAVSLHFNTAQY